MMVNTSTLFVVADEEVFCFELQPLFNFRLLNVENRLLPILMHPFLFNSLLYALVCVLLKKRCVCLVTSGRLLDNDNNEWRFAANLRIDDRNIFIQYYQKQKSNAK